MKHTCSCQRHDATGDACGGRRGFLTALAALGAVGMLAACGDSSDEAQATAPVEFDATTACELDGMLLADYPGPKAQIHYAGAAAPMFTCDTVEMFNTLLRPEQVRKVLAVYVQDMGKASWDQPRGHWIDARTAIYVQGSKRRGSMGPTIASFSQESDATKFTEQWGGKLLRYADIKPGMADLSGGALHDVRM